jgi:glycerol-3-phosphate acyltransferase PlsY
MLWKTIAAEAAAYLLGSIPFGYLLYKATEGGDVREIGSGNIGATNVLRAAGPAVAIATLLLDAGKGFSAVLIARHLAGDFHWVVLAAFLSIVGHVFPVFLNFKGGKGVATGFGAFLPLAPAPVACAAGVFILTAALTRYISLASITALATFPIILLLWGESATPLFAGAVASAALIISRHATNIHRLRSGEERRLGRTR